MALPAVGAIGGTTNAAIGAYDELPAEFTTPPLPRQSSMRASDGTEIAVLYSENRIEVGLDLISPNMQHAVVAIEDSRFYEHDGVDLRGTARALANNAAGEDVQGASTLTMQYIKNVLIALAGSESTASSSGSADAQQKAQEAQQKQNAARARSASRKLQEIRYAIELEKKLSKSEILNNYLNISYFGSGAYGVEAASRRYFAKPSLELSVVEAATLAGIVQSPTVYDPIKSPGASERRRNTVLRRMYELHYISQEQYLQARATPLADYLRPVDVPNGCAVSKYAYFCDYAKRQILNDPAFGATPEERESFLATGGLIINTTLNLKAQNAAQNSINNRIPMDDPSGKATAIAMVHPGNGAIEAMAQNREWGTEGVGKTTFNYSVDQKDGGTIGMQAGSTFKIFTIAAALTMGINPWSRTDSRDQFDFPEGDWGCPGANYAPFVGENSTSSGNFDMWEAAAYSVNTYFLQKERDAGLCNVVETAKLTGIAMANGKPIEPVPTFTLGTAEVSPLTVANAYATFSAHGVYCSPRAIENVVDRNGGGRALVPNCRQVIAPDVADGTTAILSGVVDGTLPGRTGAAMSLGRDATGKTGTTDSNSAVWFAGYTPDLAAAVWVGDPRGGFQYPMKNITINGQFYEKVQGSSLPGPIWKGAMLGALSGTPATRFDGTGKYGLRPATAGGGSDPALGPAVSAYQEFLASGSYSTRPNPAAAPGTPFQERTFTPRLWGDGTPSFEQFAGYYFSNGGQRASASLTSVPTPAPKR